MIVGDSDRSRRNGRLALKNILITAKPGTGKTTLIRKVAEAIGDRAGGFYTGEIRQDGERIGFSLTTLDGRSGTLARKGGRGPHRVGKYVVETADLEEIGVRAILEAVAAGKIIIIDEIARMELFSDAFKEAVTQALHSECTVIATIQQREDPFLNSIRLRPDVRIASLTVENRDSLAEQIIATLNV